MRSSTYGATFGQALVVVAVLALFGGITAAIYRRVVAQGLRREDAENLRGIYAAWAMYEEQNDGPPLDLGVLGSALDSEAWFLSPKDPFREVRATEFPMDPALPDWPPRSKFRISYAYIVDFVRAGKLRLEPWSQAREDRALGLLASPWEGQADPMSPFRAKVTGAVMRMRMDGSIVTVEAPTNGDHLSDPIALFGNGIHPASGSR